MFFKNKIAQNEQKLQAGNSQRKYQQSIFTPPLLYSEKNAYEVKNNIYHLSPNKLPKI